MREEWEGGWLLRWIEIAARPFFLRGHQTKHNGPEQAMCDTAQRGRGEGERRRKERIAVTQDETRREWGGGFFRVLCPAR